jgi:Ohr subfamily peroxiredoxin
MANYTGTVTATGEGRNGGHLASPDGLIDLGLAIPKELGGAGGATNPEQLFAAGWSACFMGAFRRAAAEERIRFDSIQVTANVTLNHAETTDPTAEFFLSAELEIVVGGLDEETIGTLAKRAHQVCPYSKAITGNVDVDFFARVA